MAERMMDRMMLVGITGGRVTVQGVYPVKGGLKVGPAREVKEGVVGGEHFEGWFQEQHRELRGMSPGQKPVEVPKESSGGKTRSMRGK